MPKVRTLVTLSHPTTGETFAPDTEVDVADDVAAAWRADGKVSLIADEQAAEQAASEGSYSARTGREETTSTKAEDQPKAKKG